ncbi:MAG: DMT family transporter [Candidatus Bathyarchaeota archaeon]|nr:DMT family transporter [Candidatus Bathyarchaeota archaeon]
MQNHISGIKKKAVLFTVLAGFLWGTSFPAIKIGLQYMDTYTFVFLRFLVASLIMLSVMLLTKNLSFNKKRLLLALGLVNGVAYLLQYIGMVYASASASSLYVNLTVVWVALLSPVVLKERLSRRKVASVLVSFIGVVMMTSNLDFASLGTATTLSDFLVIGAGFFWAIFIIYNKPLIQESSNLTQSMTWLVIFTMLPLLPAASVSAASISYLPATAWLAIVYTAVFCWVIPYYLWLKGLKHISPVTSAVVLLTEIIVATVISLLFLGEAFTVASGIGTILIIIAILLAS